MVHAEIIAPRIAVGAFGRGSDASFVAMHDHVRAVRFNTA
jgi:hypothetical protein